MEQGMSVRAAIERHATEVVAPVAAGNGRITIEIKRDLDLQPAEATAFEALIVSRPEVGVFVSRAWLSGLFAEPPAGVEPMLILFRDGDVLRGVAPIGILHARTHVRICLLGG